MPIDPDLFMRAACRDADPELFYQDRTHDEAMAYCARCPVRVQCSRLADDSETSQSHHYIYGVFGGETAGQRIRRRIQERISMSSRELGQIQFSAIPEEIVAWCETGLKAWTSSPGTWLTVQLSSESAAMHLLATAGQYARNRPGGPVVIDVKEVCPDLSRKVLLTYQVRPQ